MFTLIIIKRRNEIFLSLKIMDYFPVFLVDEYDNSLVIIDIFKETIFMRMSGICISQC